MVKLNKSFLANAHPNDKVEVSSKKNLPIKVLQFGEGNFLRAFVDYMIDTINDAGLFGGSVALVQPIEVGMADMINAQDGLYTVILRGLEDGREVVRKRLVTCTDSCVNPYTDFDNYIAIAKSPDLRFVVSNTTEAGIVYKEGEKPDDRPQAGFPAKVCALLYERYRYFDGDAAKGLVFIPCELIDNNGAMLKEIVLRHAKEWGLPHGFADWIENANHFTNTLVDRIVTGYPKDEIDALQRDLGYEDNLVVAAEVFHFFGIEAPSDVLEIISKELPFDKAGLNVVWTTDVTPYKQRKVRILNGAHTMSVLAAHLAGKSTVGEMMADDIFVKYLQKGIFDEIIPTLDLERDDLENFANSVFDRFANPYIRHYLMSIALNSVSKYRVRVLPSILEYYKRKDEAPAVLAFSLAALITFYKGDGHDVPDDAEITAFFRDAWENSCDMGALADKVLSKADLWGEDLTKLPGFAEKIAQYLTGIAKNGIASEIAKIS
ncbi:MAG: tagaturonate reductase [Clostridiales bacterium]|nr:tagaturonate reductase [Clostridiales bacterium]